MYIEKIHNFFPKYQNIALWKYIYILQWANTKNFDDHKMEKDFLLTLILMRFWEIFPELVFKWWTCLNKIYFPYFRLSEDLDFAISQEVWRDMRRQILKEYESTISIELEKLWLTLREERTKYDEHRLALFTFEYVSVIDASLQAIKVDISLKWELILPSVQWMIQSPYRDKILEEDLFENHTISCIDLSEALAEKMRAALTRNIPAIRDFFDIWYVKHFSDFDFGSDEFAQLLEKKLDEVWRIYTLDDAYDILESQIVTDLVPVLHDEYDFHLREVYEFIQSFRK